MGLNVYVLDVRSYRLMGKNVSHEGVDRFAKLSDQGSRSEGGHGTSLYGCL